MCGRAVTLLGEEGCGVGGTGTETGAETGTSALSSLAGTSLYLKLPFPSSKRTSFHGHSEGRVGLNDSMVVILIFFYLQKKIKKKYVFFFAKKTISYRL
jgi:hypothetical protein